VCMYVCVCVCVCVCQREHMKERERERERESGEHVRSEVCTHHASGGARFAAACGGTV